VVPLGAGSGTDALARTLIEFVRDDLRTTLFVENKPGAGGIVGGDYVAKSRPDGYTLGVFQAGVLTTAAATSPNPPYDPIRDFTPLALVGTNPLVLVVTSGSRWKTLEQFLEEAKSSPGKISCGLMGLGSHSHFNLEILRIASGAEMTRIPYSTGTGAIVTAMMGGHIDCSSQTWPAIVGQIRAGKLRALAVTSNIKEFPEIPTFAGRGFPQAGLEVFYSIVGPANLPKEALDTLVPVLERAIRNPANEAQLRKMGFSVVYEGPAQLAERIRHELAIVREVAAKIRIKQE
jgi:tripartite-type tricarboxylate transporter receptor subunit TctC